MNSASTADSSGTVMGTAHQNCAAMTKTALVTQYSPAMERIVPKASPRNAAARALGAVPISRSSPGMVRNRTGAKVKGGSASAVRRPSSPASM